ENFCQVLGFQKLAGDERFESMKARLANYNELRPMIEAAVGRMTRSEVLAALSPVGIPAGPINTVGEILEDPHIHAREMVVALTHPEYGPLRMIGIPIKLSETPGAVENAPSRFGENNREVLVAAGFSEDEITRFENGEVVTGGV